MTNQLVLEKVRQRRVLVGGHPLVVGGVVVISPFTLLPRCRESPEGCFVALEYEREGFAYTILLMWLVRGLYALGVSPRFLCRLYYRRDPGKHLPYKLLDTQPLRTFDLTGQTARTEYETAQITRSSK